MNVVAFLVTCLVTLLGLGLFVHAHRHVRNKEASTETRLAARTVRNGAGIALVVWTAIQLAYFGVLTLPDALRGPVVGNSIPATPQQHEVRPVIQPAPVAAPVQPAATGAKLEHQKQLDDLLKKK